MFISYVFSCLNFVIGSFFGGLPLLLRLQQCQFILSNKKLTVVYVDDKILMGIIGQPNALLFFFISRLYLGIEGEGQIYFSMQKNKVIQWDKVVPTTAMVCNQNLRNMISYLTPCESRKLCK